MARDFCCDISELIKSRWSPRAFASTPIDNNDLLAIFEAARYAPSCYNEQPWRFILAKSESELAKMQGILFESNLVWAKNAPVLLLILAKKTFSENGKDNYWHMFDSGTAWGYLSLEAQRRGLVTHGMGGFSKKKAVEIYSLPEDVVPLAVIAIGKTGLRETLPPQLLEREHPGERRPIMESFLLPPGLLAEDEDS